ncbi:unnamed protein product [Diabrotica balteata]|uniref:Uncharacterized protein n=1 Tax=Diabrotica balteata TaxID=107213 RepID=A0A9N9SYD8_DIABA|nr:unnamed protein product [Diabrotica balteata]
MNISSSSEFSEEDPYADSGTDYVLSDFSNSDVPGPSRRRSKHFLRVGSQKTIVCKKAFCILHEVSKNRVSQIAKNLTLGSIMSPSDNLGKQSNRPNKISESIIPQIGEHMRSFPRRKSHYSRKHNQKRYVLSPEFKNVAKMHRLYLKKYGPEKYVLEDGKDLKVIRLLVTYDFYHRQFNLNHNLNIGHPRSDAYQKCDRLNNTIAAVVSAETKTLLETEKRLHLLKAEIFYTK